VINAELPQLDADHTAFRKERFLLRMHNVIFMQQSILNIQDGTDQTHNDLTMLTTDMLHRYVFAQEN